MSSSQQTEIDFFQNEFDFFMTIIAKSHVKGKTYWRAGFLHRQQEFET